MQQRKSQREQQVFATVQKQYPITINLQPPVAPDMKIPYNADDPVEGPANARVTIRGIHRHPVPLLQTLAGHAAPSDVHLSQRREARVESLPVAVP